MIMQKMRVLAQNLLIIATIVGGVTFAHTNQARASNFPKNIKLRHGDLIWVGDKTRSIPYKVDLEVLKINRALKPNPSFGDQDAWSKMLDLSPTISTHLKQGKRKSDSFGDWVLDTLRLSVGHVAIVNKKGNQIFVVEAANKDAGVISTELEEWVSEWSDNDVFWVGRFKGLTPKEVSEVVSVASAQADLKKPYDLSNSDLLDDKSFYCSKLIWYAVMKAAGKSLDENSRSKRTLPFSPKQLINSSMVQVVYGERSQYGQPQN
ncbi:YiiX/YebB-like N1pC/P60 family cysteine hydrolase [Hyphomicrobium sp. CS1BSMeth3]|uniref:YiiX/YebB-like N1pC/P60 family cysteine hydrolase n=1 Tax=Hyphomicrobium sp. CS1BSMeth3 TaxID=1892844 RepID=UPI00092FDF4D|nr:YiiX/YebB-like N1pC/P60 family cysteine hydrolase [Hyphomicrobium sp. CS1BSMeth3]